MNVKPENLIKIANEAGSDYAQISPKLLLKIAAQLKAAHWKRLDNFTPVRGGDYEIILEDGSIHRVVNTLCDGELCFTKKVGIAVGLSGHVKFEPKCKVVLVRSFLPFVIED